MPPTTKNIFPHFSILIKGAVFWLHRQLLQNTNRMNSQCLSSDTWSRGIIHPILGKTPSDSWSKTTLPSTSLRVARLLPQQGLVTYKSSCHYGKKRDGQEPAPFFPVATLKLLKVCNPHCFANQILTNSIRYLGQMHHVLQERKELS